MRFVLLCVGVLAACSGDGTVDADVGTPMNSDDPMRECSSDLECGEGRICAEGACVTGCSDLSPCSGEGEECCDSMCTDTRFNNENCGGCAIACGADFCGPNACTSPDLGVLCEFSANLIILTGGSEEDDFAAEDVGGALEDTCDTAAKVESQSDPLIVDPSTGEPLTGPESLLIIFGGTDSRPVVSYLEQVDAAHVALVDTDGGDSYAFNGNGTAVASGSKADLETGNLDVFAVYFARDADTGAAALVAYGVFPPGTEAAAIYTEDILLPALESTTEAWFVVEWSDTDTVAGPSTDDQFRILASG